MLNMEVIVTSQRVQSPTLKAILESPPPLNLRGQNDDGIVHPTSPNNSTIDHELVYLPPDIKPLKACSTYGNIEAGGCGCNWSPEYQAPHIFTLRQRSYNSERVPWLLWGG